MSVNKSSQSSTAQSTSNQTLDPQIKQTLLDNVARTQGIANTPFQPYTGQFTADFTPDQLQAQNLFQGIASSGNPALSAGVNAASGVAGFNPGQVQSPTYDATGYNPQQASTSLYGSTGYNPASATAYGATGQGYDPAQIGSTPQAISQGYRPSTIGYTAQAQGVGAGAAQTNRGDVRDLQGGMLSSDQINGYLNPFISDVVNTNQADIERQRQIQNVQNNAQATAAHAFGGTGWGNLVGQTNDSALRAGASNSALLRAQGFDTAASLGQQDLTRSLQAGQSNQAADLATGLSNTANRQQSNINNSNLFTGVNLANAGALNNTSALNQGARNTASQFGANAANNNSQFNAQNILQTLLANQGAANTAGQFGANAQNTASLFNAGGLNTASLANQGAYNAAGQFGATAANQAAAGNAGALNSQSALNAGYANQAGQFNAGASNTANQTNVQNILAALQGNQSAGIQGANTRLAGAQTLGNLGQAQTGDALTKAAGLAASGQQEQANTQKTLDALYAQYGQSQQWPLILQQLLNQSVGLAGDPTLTNSQSTASSQGKSSGFDLSSIFKAAGQAASSGGGAAAA